MEPYHEDLPIISSEFAQRGMQHRLKLVSAYAQLLRQQSAAPTTPEAAVSRMQKKVKRKNKNLSRWEPSFTNFTSNFQGTLDYLWVSTEAYLPKPLPRESMIDLPFSRPDEASASFLTNPNEKQEEKPPSTDQSEALWELRIRSILEPVGENRVRKGRPNSRASLLSATFPSDHYALLAELAFVRGNTVLHSVGKADNNLGKEGSIT